MAIEVFCRFEQKYIIDTEKFIKLQNDISDYMELEAFMYWNMQ